MTITHSGFYLLRSSKLPLNALKKISSEAIPKEEYLLSFFSEPEFEKALYIASKDLHYEFKKLVSEPSKFTLKKKERVLQILFKYYVRMSTRCTPFGFFSGVSVGKITDKTSILRDIHNYREHIRIDMSCLISLVNSLMKIREIKKQLLFYPNNSIYHFESEMRYMDYSPQENKMNYSLAKVNSSPYLLTLLKLAEDGASISTLVNEIVDDEISYPEAFSFIEELISNKILISEFEPNLTNENFIADLFTKIKKLEHIPKPMFQQLMTIDKLIKNECVSVGDLIEIENAFNLISPNFKRISLFQADLFLSYKENTISTHIIDEIKIQCADLWKIFGKTKNHDLLDFKHKFYKKYQDQEIPLMFALDSDLGIGYGAFSESDMGDSPLLKGVFIADRKKKDFSSVKTSFEYWQKKKYLQAIDKKHTQIEINEEDLRMLSIDENETPESFYLFGELLGNKKDEGGSKEFSFNLRLGSGMSGANLLSRFCYGLDELKEYVTAHIKKEERNNDDIIYAEIIHLPLPRTGNLLQRPLFRDFEIVYLGNGASDSNHKITVNDLLLYIKDNELILKSKKLGKRIIPRLTTSHNYKHDLGVPAYKFFCDIQFQDKQESLQWDWRELKTEFFLPRVIYKNIIVKRASWNIKVSDHNEYDELIHRKEKDINEWILASLKIITKLKVFKHVSISVYDNELFIDLEKTWGLTLLADVLKKKGFVTLYEHIGSEEKCLVTSSEGVYSNEIIIPFINVNPDVVKPVQLRDSIYKSRVKRNFPPIPGENWLYLKIYSGVITADEILKNVIKPLVEELLFGKMIHKCFFVRFNDPDAHLRIRFLVAGDENNWTKTLNMLKDEMDSFTKDNNIYNIQLDTYRREIERYGNATIEFSESIFYYDSISTLHLIKLMENGDIEKKRWLLGLVSMDKMLDDFEFTLEKKMKILNDCFNYFFSEFGGNTVMENQLYKKYRDNKKIIENILGGKLNDIDIDIDALNKIMFKRSTCIKMEINGFENPSQFSSYINSVVNSYIHMLCNRIFSANRRKSELVIYYFLLKYYDSKLAISKST